MMPWRTFITTFINWPFHIILKISQLEESNLAFDFQINTTHKSDFQLLKPQGENQNSRILLERNLNGNYP